jgi:hypothetical protein
VRTYQGAVKAYIGLDRVKEALNSAKESLQRMPRNAKALSLVGQALSQLPECVDKAKVAACSQNHPHMWAGPLAQLDEYFFSVSRHPMIGNKNLSILYPNPLALDGHSRLGNLCPWQ